LQAQYHRHSKENPLGFLEIIAHLKLSMRQEALFKIQYNNTSTGRPNLQQDEG
jgi:hypothetical protein